MATSAADYARQMSTETVEALRGDSGELHVLAIDDSNVDRKVIERLLKLSCCRVTAVDSGTRALQYLSLDGDESSVGFDGLKVNLILTDYSMPGMTAYELLKKIKLFPHEYAAAVVQAVRFVCDLTLPEPVKLREVGANEDAKLTDFQQELVQMAATLCGDHKKDTYPNKLVEKMNLVEAAEYVKNSYKKFVDDLKKADEGDAADHEDPPAEAKPKSFASKFFSCLACGCN